MTERTNKEIEAYRYARELLEKGESSKIVGGLLERGFDKDFADTVYNQSVIMHRDKAERKESGEFNVKLGGGIASIGILATLIMYFFAEGNGMFAIFWGAIAFGGIQFIFGLSQQSD